jgi:tetratricopeptide (TPR) repeat protein
MKKIFLYLFFYSFFLPPIFTQELSAEQIYAKINNAIVTIYTFDANGKILSQGSGVVLNEKGWIVTNYHVYAGAEKLVVKHKEKIIKYNSIIGVDVEKDILILKITDKVFPAIQLGNSNILKVGQKIYAIGSPMGFENTISDGIISGLRSNEERTKNFIQISAAISPGSSGGAVVNAKGQLIAITTFTITKGQNLNFAIPVNDVVKIAEKGAVNQNDLSAAYYFYKGYTEYQRKNYNAAIDNYGKVISLDPTVDKAYYNLGLTYYTIGQSETAINYYKKAIAVNPRYAEAYANLGATYMDINYEAALIYLKKAVIINPDLDVAYYNLGVLFRETKQYDSSITYLKRAINLNESYTDAYYNLGSVYDRMGQIETAIMYFKKVIAINAEFVEAYSYIGALYSKKEDVETAISYFKKAIEINPQFAQGYLNLGIMYEKKGDINMKNYYFEKAYKLDPRLRNN